VWLHLGCRFMSKRHVVCDEMIRNEGNQEERSWI
jgi:hypothetical protein